MLSSGWAEMRTDFSRDVLSNVSALRVAVLSGSVGEGKPCEQEGKAHVVQWGGFATLVRVQLEGPGGGPLFLGGPVGSGQHEPPGGQAWVPVFSLHPFFFF